MPCREIPYATEQGIIGAITGNFRQRTGNFLARTGSLSGRGQRAFRLHHRCNGRCRAGDAEASPSRSSLSVCPRRAQTSLACSALSQAQPAAMAAAGWSWCVSRFRRPTPLASARQRLLKKARIVDLRDEKVRHIGAVNCMAGSKTTSRENHWHHATRCLRGFGRASCGAPDLGPMISRRRFDGGFCQGTRRTMRCLITAWLQVRVLPGPPRTRRPLDGYRLQPKLPKPAYTSVVVKTVQNCTHRKTRAVHIQILICG